MDNEDCTHNDYNEWNNVNIEKKQNNNNKTGRKVLCGGPSEEIFFSFAHNLRAFVDEIEHLISTKKYKRANKKK